MKIVLRPSDLILTYLKWKERIKEINLSDEEKKWLNSWEFYDLSVSPMEDNVRRFIRYGHYLGWFEPKKY